MWELCPAEDAVTSKVLGPLPAWADVLRLVLPKSCPVPCQNLSLGHYIFGLTGEGIKLWSALSGGDRSGFYGGA